MDCSVAKLLLSEFLDEALPAGKDGDLRGHLQACPGCSKELAGLKSLSGLLKALPRPPLPEGFMARVHKRKAAAPPRETPPFAAPRALAFGLTAVLAGVIAYRAARPSYEPAEPPPPVPLAVPMAAQPARPPSAPAAARGLAGAPIQGPAAAPAGYTNEDLHRMLVDESKKMGITAIGVQEEPKKRSLLGPQTNTPESRQFAESAVRELAAMRRQIDEGAGKVEPVPLEGNTAALLGEEAAGGKVLEAEPPSAARPNDWTGQHAGDLAGGRTIDDAATWREVWAKVSAEPPPPVDFAREQIVAVFLGRRPTGGYSVEIVEVPATESFITVRYREKIPPARVPPPEGETSPYALRAVPKSALPVRFEKLP